MILHPVHTDEHCDPLTSVGGNVERIFASRPKLTASPGDQKRAVRIADVSKCIADGPVIQDQSYCPKDIASSRMS